MIVLLHGFWGQPADFQGVIRELPIGQEIWAPDLFAPGPLSPASDLASWTQHFLHALRERTDRPATLVGYSMGGRLALHALTRRPEFFDRALLVSAAPYYTETKPNGRAEWEAKWANCFLGDDWDLLARNWEGQDVLKDSSSLARRVDENLRVPLSRALDQWSPRRHQFGPGNMKALPATVDWMFGALDQKYLGVAKVLQDLPVRGQIKLVQNAGHRVIVDQPSVISRWIGD